MFYDVLSLSAECLSVNLFISSSFFKFSNFARILKLQASRLGSHPHLALGALVLKYSDCSWAFRDFISNDFHWVGCCPDAHVVESFPSRENSQGKVLVDVFRAFSNEGHTTVGVQEEMMLRYVKLALMD